MPIYYIAVQQGLFTKSVLDLARVLNLDVTFCATRNVQYNNNVFVFKELTVMTVKLNDLRGSLWLNQLKKHQF